MRDFFFYVLSTKEVLMSYVVRWAAAQQKIPRHLPSPCLVFRPAAPQRRLRCTAALKTEHTVDLTEESLADLAAALQESPALARTIAANPSRRRA